MPVQKPRGRKRASHKKAYASIVLLVILAGSSLTYAYFNGFLSIGPEVTTTTSSNTTGCPGSVPTNGDTYARVNTTVGSFEVELYTSLTPQTVSNFVSLSKSGFYNNLVWWRIEPGFVIQTGDPNTRNANGSRSTWGQGTSGTSIPFEDAPSLHNTEGYLAMASTGAKIGGSSQFFINLGDNSASLDGNYAVFGKVICGLNVVLALGSVPVEADPSNSNIHEPVTPVFVNTITILNG